MDFKGHNNIVLEIVNDDDKGRCVYTCRIPHQGIYLRKNETIMFCPVLIYDPNDVLLDVGGLDRYPMTWDEKNKCLVMGLINFVHRSNDPNCKIERDFKNTVMRLVAIKEIKYGEELTI